MCGGISDLPGRENHPEAIQLARFAVAEHDTKTSATLKFERLVRVRQQLVAGTMHYFTIDLREPGGAKRTYEAKVWVKLWANLKELQSFEPVGDAAAA